MVEIYTDASVGKTAAVATSFILTDKNYIGSCTTNLEGVTTSIQGEVQGAIAAIEYARDGTKLHGEDITLYTDSIAMLNLLKCNLGRTTNQQAQLYEDDLRKLKQLVKKYKINMCLIKGHDLGHNPNKVVDLISNSKLRLRSKEVNNNA